MIENLRLMLCVALTVVCAFAAAEDYSLPDRAELSTYSADGLSYYTEGIRALDRADYINAYGNLMKSAQLQPDALRLNMLAGALAMREGRRLSANDSPEEYANAVACYQNIVRLKDLDAPTRRIAINKLKMAMQEGDALRLAQRDARREAMGTQFVIKLNQEMITAKSALSGESDTKKQAKATSSDKDILQKKAIDSPKEATVNELTDNFFKMQQQLQKMYEQQLQQQQQGGQQQPGMMPGMMPGGAAPGMMPPGGAAAPVI